MEPDEPPKFTNLCHEEFDNVFLSPNLREHASEEQKLSVIFKCLDVSRCSREVVGGYLDFVDFSQISEDFWMDFICANPILTANKDLRQVSVKFDRVSGQQGCENYDKQLNEMVRKDVKCAKGRCF